MQINSRVPTAADIDMAGLMSGAEDWNWEDMESEFLTPKKLALEKNNKPATEDIAVPTYSRETCTRCTVEDVIAVQNNGRFQKDLIVRLDQGNERRSVILLDDWTMADIFVGDTVNVLGDFVPISSHSSYIKSMITISSKSNLLIHHPDNLITVTALSNALQCRRKPILSGLVRSSSDTTPSLVWGNMLHEVMQTCLNSGHWEETWIHGCIDDVIIKGLAELLRIGVGIEEAKRELRLRAKGLGTFSQKYIANLPKPEAILTDTRSRRDRTALLAISRLYDFEEDIWSPTYGIKGKLDATVEAVICDQSSSPLAIKPVITSGPKPFEIKTGRTVAGMEHRAQTMLYTLLTAERYGVEVPSGLLYYTQTDEVVNVPASRNELRGLFIARNEMVGSMMGRSKNSGRHGTSNNLTNVADPDRILPPTIDDERICNKCFALDICMLYRKAVENVTDDTSPIADTFDLKTSHINPIQASFFKKWEALISLEERDLLRFKKELWTMDAKERERKGRCFSAMVMDTTFIPTPKLPDLRDSKIRQHMYKFVRSRGGKGVPSLLNGHMSCGDAITVSVEPHLLALARGFIVQLTPQEVVVGTDHDLNLDTITRLAIPRSGLCQSGQDVLQVVFRIDKDELFSGMGRLRDNLAQIFYVDGDSRSLELVVDLKSPRFHDSDYDVQRLDRCPVSLNKVQQRAVSKVLSAQDYALILGMPGTGKTTVIASIIRTLVGMGKTVLLTSYTHSAVDTILLKLKDDADFGILRLGNLDKVHPAVHKFTLVSRRAATTIDQLDHQIMSPPVVATTCLSIDHALFTRRRFDYCIVDEASQITLPTCLGPLRFADKFVLVGDHFQLPPLVRSINAQKGGFDISLFRRLSDTHPHAVIDLTDQYRMNEDIMLLSNKLIYGGRLRCGSEAVAKRALVIPDRKFLHDIHTHRMSLCDGDQCWLDQLMSESCKAIFVDTDLVPAKDSRIGDLVQNEVEANLVHQVVETMLCCGVLQHQIGIISLYRQQIKILSHLLQNRQEMEILTADRSQGRDKDCIIISMVRSNDAGQVGDFVKDWRRMNVSFTRARSKLIIFGSRKTLQAAPLLKEFFTLMETQDWILSLPTNAHQMHYLPNSSPGKRAAEDVEACSTERELLVTGTGRPVKRVKVKWPIAREVLRGRPILKDLLNNQQ